MKILKHPVPDEFLKYIGDIVVSFALLELQIKSLVWLLLGNKQRIGQIVTSELSFKKLLDLSICLFKEKYDGSSKLEKLQTLVKNANKLTENNIKVDSNGNEKNTCRNLIIHSLWVHSNDPNQIIKMKTTAKSKTGLKYKSEELSKDELSDFAIEIKKLSYEVLNFSLSLQNQASSL